MWEQGYLQLCSLSDSTAVHWLIMSSNGIIDFYLQVGQQHGGFTGMIQKACSLAQRHMWFERKVAEDRKMVAERSVLLCKSTVLCFKPDKYL